jgi:hypothetical protein
MKKSIFSDFVVPKGSGFLEDPYLITSPEELAWINYNLVINDDPYDIYSICNDIDLIEYDFFPIGYHFMSSSKKEISEFKGTIYGNKHTIKNMNINCPLSDYVGFISMMAAGKIVDLSFDSNCTIIGHDNVGCICGKADISAFNNCYSAAIVTGNKRVGGLIGLSHSTSDMRDCGFYGCCRGKELVGGICGFNNSTSLRNIKVHCKVLGDFYVGGIFGYTEVHDRKIFNIGGMIDVSGKENIGSFCGLVYIYPKLEDFKLSQLVNLEMLSSTITIESGYTEIDHTKYLTPPEWLSMDLLSID